MHPLSIKKLPVEDQPRQKMFLKGSAALTNAELIAIIINAGCKDQSAIKIAHQLLESSNQDLQQLGAQSLPALLNKKIKGMGTAKAITLMAAMELGIRRNLSNHRKAIVSKSSDIAHYLKSLLEFQLQEIFVVVYLNRANKITNHEIISMGGITGTIADLRIILKKALENNATSLILCHNHPSGNLNPSKADHDITQKIKQAANLLDIQLLDHIIVSNEGYYSFADEGGL